jgi:hypothetical protein
VIKVKNKNKTGLTEKRKFGRKKKIKPQRNEKQRPKKIFTRVAGREI